MHPPNLVLEPVDASTDCSFRVCGCIHWLYNHSRWMHPLTLQLKLVYASINSKTRVGGCIQWPKKNGLSHWLSSDWGGPVWGDTLYELERRAINFPEILKNWGGKSLNKCLSTTDEYYKSLGWLNIKHQYMYKSTNILPKNFESPNNFSQRSNNQLFISSPVSKIIQIDTSSVILKKTSKVFNYTQSW